MKLTIEQQARALEAYGVCANEACDGCGKMLAEVRWTRRDMPETYCSQLCRDGVERGIGRCDGCGVDLAGKRRGARWCSDTCRMRNRGKDSANNPKTSIQKIGLQRQKSILAMAPPGRPFLLITRKEITRSAKSREQELVNELRWKTGANPSNPGVELGTTGLVFLRGV